MWISYIGLNLEYGDILMYNFTAGPHFVFGIIAVVCILRTQTSKFCISFIYFHGKLVDLFNIETVNYLLRLPFKNIIVKFSQ